jgi:glycyl-tRNA synthetase beta chain
VAEFLFEIGLEEVPARMIPGAEAELLRRTVAMLERARLVPKDVALLDPTGGFARSYSTPRRLAVWVKDVMDKQATLTEEVTGPAVKIAFKDGVATPAAEAFARKNGVAVSELKRVETPKGEYLSATTVQKGRTAAEVIAAEMPKELAAIYWAKNMYWRAGKPERFVRPVLWMACLLGDAVVPVEFGGRKAGRVTYGHRVLAGPQEIAIEAPAKYAEQMERAFVLVDVETRRQKIRKALDAATRGVAGARWREDEELVDQVTHLTEWPEVLLGGFESTYLGLPEEVLVTVMRDHQKYFAVEDASGKLTPHFLAVLNIELTAENGPVIRQGNERVLRARFNDARFFWEFDQRIPLRERVKLLENVTFQKDLGSYKDKTERVLKLVKELTWFPWFADQIKQGELGEAVLLAKADLTTELVKEFTELQGIVGGLYARAQGLPVVVAEAIYDQYKPAGADDDVPRSVTGAVLGVADRADTIAGMFGLGFEPTGSKDPFALRRAANGIVKILAEKELPLALHWIIEKSTENQDVAAKMRDFFRERVVFYLREVRGIPYDVVDAVGVELRPSQGNNDILYVLTRAEAIVAVRGRKEFQAIVSSFKRMKNILEQAKFPLDDRGIDLGYYRKRTDAEAVFAMKAFELSMEVEQLYHRNELLEALEKMSTLQPEVDGFFESVMVMDPDPEVRHRRLQLLAFVLFRFSQIADFSKLVIVG